MKASDYNYSLHKPWWADQGDGNKNDALTKGSNQ